MRFLKESGFRNPQKVQNYLHLIEHGYQEITQWVSVTFGLPNVGYPEYNYAIRTFETAFFLWWARGCHLDKMFHLHYLQVLDHGLIVNLHQSWAATFFIHVLNWLELKSLTAVSKVIWQWLHKCSPSIHSSYWLSPFKSLESKQSSLALAFIEGSQNVHVSQG